ncbi:MnhB domain-containing protein [Actinomadura rupiterrae]|uniref:MnhB domain-containing protein n=1 Tax=Actinomadura rupiterrae TaxID=559627 RepID=UPI0020A5EF78|nr:MnhB domain-containing protein [Actinomadura rupiterrae]MCP2336311.1 multicomponent Na+:H+ antiporter subunit B [Actinomadura rupiterrae]
MHPRNPHRRPFTGAFLTGGFAALLAAGLLAAPREDAPLSAMARHALAVSLPDWKLTEPVNEIVYGTRGFDTFGETFLLLAAVVSVLVLTRPRELRTEPMGEERAGRREQAEDDPASPVDARERAARRAERAEQDARTPMTPVVRTAVRVVGPILFAAGCYLVAWGYAPGGGFPAGAVLAGVMLMVYAAFGRRTFGTRRLETAELAGALGIIVIMGLGLVLKDAVGADWVPHAAERTPASGGIVQPFSVAEFAEVGTGILLAVHALLGARHDWTPDEAGAGEGVPS